MSAGEQFTRVPVRVTGTVSQFLGVNSTYTKTIALGVTGMKTGLAWIATPVTTVPDSAGYTGVMAQIGSDTVANGQHKAASIHSWNQVAPNKAYDAIWNTAVFSRMSPAMFDSSQAYVALMDAYIDGSDVKFVFKNVGAGLITMSATIMAWVFA
jgi:hypothetical protein